jgi:hypothetical protein
VRELRGQRLGTQLDLTQLLGSLLALEVLVETQKGMRIKEIAAVILQPNLTLGEAHFVSPMIELNLLLRSPVDMTRANCREHFIKRLIAQSAGWAEG